MGNRGPGKDKGFGGKYTRKAENLTKKELKAAGAAKAAKKRTVSISDTKRDYGKGKTLGPGGKPLTGSVRLENGNMAVYKDGKRVVKAKPAAKPAASSGTRSGSTARPAATPTPKGKNPPPSGAKPPSVGDVRPGVHGRKNRWDGKKWVRVETAGSGYQAGSGQTARPKPPSSATPSHYTGSSVNKPGGGTRKPPGNGSPAAKVRDWVGGLRLPSGSPGDRYNKAAKRWETYKNGKWVPGRKGS